LKLSLRKGNKMAKSEQLREILAGILYLHKDRSYYQQADQILRAFKNAGGAFVDRDAKLPKPPLARISWYGDQHSLDEDDQMLYREGQKDMLKASYRKIEEIERPYGWEDWDDC